MEKNKKQAVEATLKRIDEPRENDKVRRLTMERGVSQLLFNYLPGRIVGWENGLAIVQLGMVKIVSAWSAERSQPILDELALWLDRWKGIGIDREDKGEVDEFFPDPRYQAGRFVIGEPVEIKANFFETALHCTKCSRLVFRKSSELGQKGFFCHVCKQNTLRQFSQVLVHGCGEVFPMDGYLPGLRKNESGELEIIRRPLRCPKCGKNDELMMPSRSERIRDIYIKCHRCDLEVLTRITARCPKCAKKIIKERSERHHQIAKNQEQEEKENNTAIARVAMRMTLYNASEAYYPHSFSKLRLEKVSLLPTDPDLQVLSTLLPLDRQPHQAEGIGSSLDLLLKQLKDAERSDDQERVQYIQQRMLQILQPGNETVEIQSDTREGDCPLQDDDLVGAIEESIAFKTTVRLQPWNEIIQGKGGVSKIVTDRVTRDLARLGLREMQLVEDLPVISATFGYTRRSAEPAYKELSASNLPTTLRAFPPLDRSAARILGSADFAGTTPILAREGMHEGIFLSLDPARVLRWAEENKVVFPCADEEPIKRLLAALEPIDRYHDNIWKRPARRLIFGLVHSLSHALMRVTSNFAGLERTSISEYILLPLLGTVVFDNSNAFTLGGIEMMMRDNLIGVLERLQEEAMDCIFDVSCIDKNGACPGCIHSPDIACRVFNHGLSRAFLIGGHAPWSDISSEERIIGYWEIP